MTIECALFSLLKSLWLRSTGQPGWCNCVICKDKMLNLPDPLGFSQDARKFQKQLRKVPKAYRCKPCVPTRDHHNHSSHRHTNNEDIRCNFTPEKESTPPRKKSSIVKHDQLLPPISQPTKAVKTVSFSDPLEQHYSPDRDATSNGYSEGYTYIQESKMDKCDEEKDGKWNCISEIIRSMETRADASNSSAGYAAEGNHEATCNDDNGYSLYEAHPPLKLSMSYERFNENDSNDSYGTITSQEILEAYEKAAEELALASVKNLERPPPPCFDDNYLCTDVVYLSSVNCTDV